MNIKKHHFVYYSIIASFMFSFLFGSAITLISHSSFQTYSPLKSASNGVSNFNILQSVKYRVDINYSVSQSQGESKYYFKIPRLDNRTQYSPLTRYCPPYQESELLYNHITHDVSTYSENLGFHDRFNNTYDAFNATLNGSSSHSVKISQSYNVTLNQISFSDIQDSDIGSYNYSDIMFDLYCNISREYMNTSDPDLISLSNNIVDSGDNPVEKASKIISWISSYIEYFSQSDHKGASWAYENRKGDCSEYADLMITLLRIQNIPARKITGLLVSNDPTFRPVVGQEYTYNWGNTGKPDDTLGHAWVEYYVPAIGWIACDPTWNEGGNYFNQIDYLRFGFTAGSWIKNALGNNTSEFGYPSLLGESLAGDPVYEYDYEFKLTILETNLNPQTDIWDLLIFIIIILAIIGVIIIIIYIIYKVTIGRRRSSELTAY